VQGTHRNADLPFLLLIPFQLMKWPQTGAALIQSGQHYTFVFKKGIYLRLHPFTNHDGRDDAGNRSRYSLELSRFLFTTRLSIGRYREIDGSHTFPRVDSELDGFHG
jgi:hypothetical protein